MPDAKAATTATVVIKVIRRDGTEEVHYDGDATVTEVGVVEKLIKKLKG